MNAPDVDGAAVRLAFHEASQDTVTARIRHAFGRGCTGVDCETCRSLRWAESVFRSWNAADIGADDLEAAIYLLRSAK